MRYLITFSCYGAHLHGDEAGSIDRHNNQIGNRSLDIDPRWREREQALMKDPPFLLDHHDKRSAVLAAIREVCEHKSWTLMAAHIRSTHVHTIVEADETPERIMNTFKAYASRLLNSSSHEARKRWARDGSTKRLWNDEQVRRATKYVVDEQGTKMVVYHSGAV